MRVPVTIVERPAPDRPGIWLGFIVPDGDVSTIVGDLAVRHKRVPVVVSLGGIDYRSSLLRKPDGWEFIASLDFRDKTGTALGDLIEPDITLDTKVRAVAIPDDVVAELASERGAREWWDGLSYSHQREIMLYVDDAKRPETRVRRISAIIAAYRREAGS